MKLGETIIKIGLAIAAVAGIAFLIVKYMDMDMSGMAAMAEASPILRRKFL